MSFVGHGKYGYLDRKRVKFRVFSRLSFESYHMATAFVHLSAYLFILFSLPLRTKAELLHLQLVVASEGDVHPMNQTASCTVGDPCPSLISALHKAGHVQTLNNSNTNDIRRIQLDLELILLAGTHYIPYGTELSNINLISLVGKGQNTTYLTCQRTSRDDTAAAINFFSFQEVILKHLTVTGCTGYGGAVAGGAVFEMSRGINLSISHCHFCNNTGVAVLASDLTFINISWTTFSSSTHVSNVSAGLHAVYSKPVRAHHTNSLSVSFCHFESLTYLPVVKKSSDSQLGAGLSVVLDADNGQGNIQLDVAIMHSTFVSNNANSGAGIYFRIDQVSRSFNITVNNCQFEKCSAVQAQAQTQENLEGGHGGGLVLVLHGKSQGTVEILNSRFVSNSATMGAAVAVLYLDEVLSTNVTIVRSVFCNNMATSVGAVAFLNFLSINQWSHGVTMRDVKLENNSGSALVMVHVDVYLEGHVIIAGNNGSAVIVQNRGWLVVRDSVKFVENRGRNGGALQLSNSQLMLDDSADVEFVNNTAKSKGGAIWASTSDMVEVNSLSTQHLHNSMCFIRSTPQSSTSPNRRDYSPQGNITFINNRADRAGGAIYANSIDSCSWSAKTNSYQAAAVFFSPNFFYKNNSRQNITSGVANLSAILSKHKHSNSNFSPNLPVCDKSRNAYCVIPGIVYKLSVTSIDGMQNPVSTTVIVSTNMQSAVRIVHHGDELLRTNATSQKIDKSFSFVTDYISGTGRINVYFRGPIHEVGQVVVQSDADSAIKSLNIPVMIQDCVPGFRYEHKHQICMCDTESHVHHCTNDALIQPDAGYWIGQVVQHNHSSHARTVSTSYWCPPTYCRCPNGSCEFDMRGDLDHQCADGREGTLCGYCKQNYSAVYGAIYPTCLPCSDEVRWILPMLTIIAFIIVALAVLINFNASSKRVRSAAFYLQVVALALSAIPPHGILQYRWISHLALIPTLNIRMDACLLDNMTTLQSTLFQYYIPGCVFVFMALGIFLARKFARISRIHVLRPFWSMVTLTYVGIAYTTALILNCVDMGDGELRWFPDATVKCYEGSHRNAAIAAFLIGGLYVIPLPIFLALAMPRIHKMKPMCDIFLEPIKPSYRWAEGWYFFRRLVLVVVHCFTVNPFIRHTLIMSLFCILLAIHAQAQPFSWLWVNRVETALILNLCVISAFQMYFSSGPMPVEVTIVFFLIPYMAVILYFIYFVAQNIRKNHLKKHQQQVAQSSHTIDPTAEVDCATDTASNNDTKDRESVALMDIASENATRLAASFERNGAMDMMDDSKPFLREPLLLEIQKSKPK